MQTTDIIIRLSGGAGNTDPNASLGGAPSNTAAAENLHSLFDYVNPTEAETGESEYRAIDIKNAHATETYYGAIVYISPQTTSANTSIAIAYDSTGTQTIATENDAPSAPTLSFTAPADRANGILVGDIVAAGTKRIWVKRIVDPTAAKLAGDACQLTIEGGGV